MTHPLSIAEDSDYFAFFNSYKKSLKDFLMINVILNQERLITF